MIRYKFMGKFYKHSDLIQKINSFSKEAQLSIDYTSTESLKDSLSKSFKNISGYVGSFKKVDLTEREQRGAAQMNAVSRLDLSSLDEKGLLDTISSFYTGLSTFNLSPDPSRPADLLKPIQSDIIQVETIYNKLKSVLGKTQKENKRYTIDQQAAYLVNNFSYTKSNLRLDEKSPYDPSYSEKEEESKKEKLVIAYKKAIDSFISIFSKLPKELSLPDSYMSKEDIDMANKYSVAKMKAEDFVNKSMLFTGVDMTSDPKVLLLKDLLSKVPSSSGVKSVVSEINEYSKTLLNIKIGATKVDGLLQSLLEFINMSENKYGMRTVDMKKRSTSLLSWIRQKSNDGSKESLNEVLAAVNRFLIEFCNTEPKLKTEKEYYAVWRNIRSVQGQQ